MGQESRMLLMESPPAVDRRQCKWCSVSGLELPRGQYLQSPALPLPLPFRRWVLIAEGRRRVRPPPRGRTLRPSLCSAGCLVLPRPAIHRTQMLRLYRPLPLCWRFFTAVSTPSSLPAIRAPSVLTRRCTTSAPPARSSISVSAALSPHSTRTRYIDKSCTPFGRAGI